CTRQMVRCANFDKITESVILYKCANHRLATLSGKPNACPALSILLPSASLAIKLRAILRVAAKGGKPPYLISIE
ncbi:hypothetical protein ACFSBU_21765, partial [Thalassotalea marina]|uniref:hypothetical protein n=1 Tax=Thalassotalea marina TaxID=1673741 RepID=UPI003628FA6F